jgi:hypothetical protein
MAEEKKTEEKADDPLGDGLMDIFEDAADEESDLADLTNSLEDVDGSDLLRMAQQILSDLERKRAELGV